LRKYLVLAIAAAALLALTAVSAFAALDHTYSVKVKPSKAGTKAKPRNVVVAAGLAVVHTAPDAENPTADPIVLYFPKQFAFNNRRFKKCSVTKVAGGIAACPAGSRIGQGTASATVGPGDAPLEFDTTFFNAGANKLVIHLQPVTPNGDDRPKWGERQKRQGFYESPVGTLSRAGGKYGRKLTVDIPEGVKKPGCTPNAPCGTYSKLIKLDFTLDKKYKGQTFIRSTGCKGGSYAFSSRLEYDPNPNPPSVSNTTKSIKVPCKK